MFYIFLFLFFSISAGLIKFSPFFSYLFSVFLRDKYKRHMEYSWNAFTDFCPLYISTIPAYHVSVTKTVPYQLFHLQYISQLHLTSHLLFHYFLI